MKQSIIATSLISIFQFNGVVLFLNTAVFTKLTPRTSFFYFFSKSRVKIRHRSIKTEPTRCYPNLIFPMLAQFIFPSDTRNNECSSKSTIWLLRPLNTRNSHKLLPITSKTMPTILEPQKSIETTRIGKMVKTLGNETFKNLGHYNIHR